MKHIVKQYITPKSDNIFSVHKVATKGIDCCKIIYNKVTLCVCADVCTCVCETYRVTWVEDKQMYKMYV